MSKLIDLDEVVALIKDGATVGASALAMAGWPETIAVAMEKRFLETGHPAGLTIVHASGIGDWGGKGTSHFAHTGMIRRWIGGHTGLAPAMAKMIIEGGCEGYNLPQGTIAQLWREIAAHRPGVITKIGLSTFVDPRVEGGKVNKSTTEEIVKVIQLEGEEWLLYPSFKVDVAIIRGTVADEFGNLTVSDEGALLECLPLAQAAKNSGGIVIAEVEYVAQTGTLRPKRVRVPGVLIDYIVVAQPQDHWQSAGTQFNPAFSGEIRVPVNELPEMKLDERLIIARRAAMELVPGSCVNLGIGMPEGVATVASLEGVADQLTLTTESGAIGGIPASGHNFGMSYNALAYVEQQVQFDFHEPAAPCQVLFFINTLSLSLDSRPDFHSHLFRSFVDRMHEGVRRYESVLPTGTRPRWPNRHSAVTGTRSQINKLMRVQRLRFKRHDQQYREKGDMVAA